ncbi:MAG: hypothetical protein KF724_07670 [Phycisphaeraceae bacterium]|nr:hypothetical protein [Phycisphaeraceae bacterium]
MLLNENRSTHPVVEIVSAGPLQPVHGRLLGLELHEWRAKTRAELGLSTVPERVVTGAGHQAFFWHPGILAKFSLARGLAGADGTVVHLVVDHDLYEPALVRVPVRASEDGRILDAVTHRFAPPAPGRPAMAQALFEPRPYEGPEPALLSVRCGLIAAQNALSVAARRMAPHGHTSNAAMQVAAALSSLMAPWVGATHLVADSDLLSTSFGKALVDEMRRNPRRCAESFNAALALDPHAARPLRIADDVELPVWSMSAEGARLRVMARDLAAAPRDRRWLPRAFLLSAMVRLGLCDRFVHGLGAQRYERVTEAWFGEWLGVTLPPVDIASATLRLPLAPEGEATEHAPSPSELRALRLNPEAIDLRGASDAFPGVQPGSPLPVPRGEPGTLRPGPRKAALLRAISDRPRRSPARRSAYQELLRELEAMRHERAGALADLEARAAAAEATRRSIDLARDRTWPFVYFDPAALDHALSGVAWSSAGASGAARGSGR